MFELEFTANEGRFKKGLDSMTDKELCRMLTAIAKAVEKGSREGWVIDLEGNKIGQWSLRLASLRW